MASRSFIHSFHSATTTVILAINSAKLGCAPGTSSCCKRLRQAGWGAFFFFLRVYIFGVSHAIDGDYIF
jgi:hypothetical protein